MKILKNKFLLLIPFLLIIIAVGFIIATSFDDEKEIITGIVESVNVDVASKIPGRIDSIFVSEGESVAKGTLLARLESKEMEAKLGQAKGARQAAYSKLEMANNGARKEEVEAVKNLYLQAQHQLELAEKTWDRVKSLYDDEVISSQERDEVEFKYRAAKEQFEAAESKYKMVKEGARAEEKRAAEGLFLQADNSVNEAEAYYDELSLRSPINGEVSARIVDPGEIISSGYPVFTIVDLKDSWITLQIREDNMNRFRKGETFTGRIPALGNLEKDFEVTYISPMGAYADWKPTDQKNDFDLKTFEIRLRSVEPIEALRPGMTVNIIL